MPAEDAFEIAVVYEYLTRWAVQVGATEAAAFAVRRARRRRRWFGRRGAAAGSYELVLAAHIRPDDSLPAKREAAIAAFRDIVRPCVDQDKDDVIEVGAPGPGEPFQFCLVHVIRAEGVVRGAAAWIVPAADQPAARELLRRITGDGG